MLRLRTDILQGHRLSYFVDVRPTGLASETGVFAHDYQEVRASTKAAEGGWEEDGKNEEEICEDTRVDSPKKGPRAGPETLR